MKPSLKHALAAIILALSLTAPVAAVPFEDATAAYDRGDYATALRLVRLLADQGNTEAQFLLGTMYDDGRGVQRNYAEGLKWHRLAADQGHAWSQYVLGTKYYHGVGAPQNYAEALKWYRLAADQGDVIAQYFLGFMYKEGQGVPQDYVRAHMWFNLAAAHGNQLSVAPRDSIAKLMTPAQIAEAQKLALEWQPKGRAQEAGTLPR